MILRYLPFALSACLVAACQGRDEGAATAHEAVEITRAQISKETPQMDLRMFVIDTKDLGGRWQVTYEIPGGSTGTPIIFEVDKKSGEIVDTRGGQ